MAEQNTRFFPAKTEAVILGDNKGITLRYQIVDTGGTATEFIWNTPEKMTLLGAAKLAAVINGKLIRGLHIQTFLDVVTTQCLNKSITNPDSLIDIFSNLSSSQFTNEYNIKMFRRTFSLNETFLSSPIATYHKDIKNNSDPNLNLGPYAGIDSLVDCIDTIKNPENIGIFMTHFQQARDELWKSIHRIYSNNEFFDLIDFHSDVLAGKENKQEKGANIQRILQHVNLARVALGLDPIPLDRNSDQFKSVVSTIMSEIKSGLTFLGIKMPASNPNKYTRRMCQGKSTTFYNSCEYPAISGDYKYPIQAVGDHTIHLYTLYGCPQIQRMPMIQEG